MIFTRDHNPRKALKMGVYHLADRILQNMNRECRSILWKEIPHTLKGVVVSWGYQDNSDLREVGLISIPSAKKLYPDLYQKGFIEIYSEERRSAKYQYIIIYDNKKLFDEKDRFGFNTIEGWLNDPYF